MKTNNNNIARFQKKHFWLFFSIFIFIIVAFIILIINQSQGYLEQDEKALLKYFQEFKKQIDTEFQNIEDSLIKIRISAEADLFESRQNGVRFPFSYQFIEKKTDGNYYHMDNIKLPYRENIHINLTGDGEFRNRGRDFDRFTQMALNLSDDFYGLKRGLPNLIYVYCMTVNKQFVHHPWVPSKKYHFEDSAYSYDVWKQSLPENNPQRKLFWTDVYIDVSDGGGLMTSSCVPLYDQDKFIGMIGVDITVDFLNEIAGGFEPQRKGCMIVFDEHQNMLADPNVISYKDKKVKNLKEGLPKGLVFRLDNVLNAPDNAIIKQGKWEFIKSPLKYSPYSILYYYPRQTLMKTVIGRMGYGNMGFIACMLLLVFSSLFITYKKLVRPAEQFVNFILAKSRGSSVIPREKFPKMWRPWFSTIEKVFDENAELTENIKNKNLELTKSNVDLQNEMEARNKAESEKVDLERQLIQAEKTKAIGLLAGGVAHDFNNQLAIIIGYGTILSQKKDLDEEKYKKGLDAILASAKNSANLTKQLLAFAQKGTYQNIPMNIHLIIKEVMSILKHTIDKRISIKEELLADIRTLTGDPAQIQNMIMNIAINAKHAMPNGGMLIFKSSNVVLSEEECIDPEFALEPGKYIKISISDTGVGMDEETKMHIFEPFFTTNLSGDGTGLGLAAAHGTIKKHHGSISVESSPGAGTAFNIFLPVVEITLASKLPEKPKEPKENKAGAGVLLVDDELGYCRMMTEFLGSLGYEVKTFNDPLKAIEHYRKSWTDFDMVMVDMMMPKFNGRDLINELEKINQEAKIIIASGFASEKYIQDLIRDDDHVVAFFKKPFDLVEFADRLLDLLSDKNV
jgi:signal transduction histidine kinase/CheY-like chemotaxis protein